MKLESRYYWIVLTFVGDSTTTSDFLATLYPFARDSGSHEALALELPYPPFDLERHEKRGGPSGRQPAPFDDVVYANGFPPDNSQ